MRHFIRRQSKKIMSKTIMMTVVAIISTGLLGVSLTSKAQTATDAGSSTGGAAGGGDILYYLMLIEKHTNNILANVNNLPTYLQSLTALALGVLAEDDSDSTASLQAGFATLTNDYTDAQTAQKNVQPKILQDFFGTDVNAQTVPYANDMVYTALLGQPFLNPDPRSTSTNKVDTSYNYLKNITGIGIKHLIPSRTWKGTAEAQQKYMTTYQTLNSIQTYNAYVLGQIYADAQNGYQVTSTQSSLISQASDPSWFTAIASENIGIVLRQILMYNSQMYVVLTQLLQTQRQQLAVQAMANTLLIVGNQFTEDRLAGKASVGG